MDFGYNLMLLEGLHDLGISDLDISRKLKVSRPTVSRWRNGDNAPHHLMNSAIFKTLDFWYKDVIREKLDGYAKEIGLPEVGTTGITLCRYQLDFGNEHPWTVTESGLKPDGNPHRWFDYNMVVTTTGKDERDFTYCLMDRFSPEGNYFFFTKEEVQNFLDKYKVNTYILGRFRNYEND